MRRSLLLLGLLGLLGARLPLTSAQDVAEYEDEIDLDSVEVPVAGEDDEELVATPEDENDSFVDAEEPDEEPEEEVEEAVAEPEAEAEPPVEPKEAEVAEEASTAVSPVKDEGCHWSWSQRKCVPAAYCQYKYQFLDATPGESCRLRKRRLVKHTVSGGLQKKPAVVIAAATALVVADVAVVAFTPALKRFPLLFNVIQGFVLFLAGDAYFQVLEQGLRAKAVGVRVWRAVRSGLIGALNNGLVHYSYYKFIDQRFPYHLFRGARWGPEGGVRQRIGVAWTKYWLEWPTIGAYKIASMYFLTAAMGGDLANLAEKFRKRFWLTMLRSLQVWPLYDTILYAYVPTAHRPLFNAFMSIAWGGYLSHISQPEVEETGEEADAAASGGDDHKSEL